MSDAPDLSMNQGFAYRETVSRAHAGRTLLSHMTDRYRHTDGDTWNDRIREGLVLLDGAPADPAEVLRPGQRLTWLRPPWREPEAPLDWVLLYEDADLLAAAKPSGLPTLPGAGYLEHTLLALVRRRFPEASPLHRLGRGTSGIVLFTRTAHAAQSLSKAWRDRTVTKVYRALVEGAPVEDEFVVEAPIGPVAHASLGMVNAAHPAGKASRSRVRVLERRGSESLVEVIIETGRPHQIRIHMAACGHPLAGDPLYAPGGGFKGDARPGDVGYLLHALRLALPHPRTGAPLEILCPPPVPLRAPGEVAGSGGGN